MTPDGLYSIYNQPVMCVLKQLIIFSNISNIHLYIQHRQFLFCFILGFYRVNYDEENWRSLIEHLKNNPVDISVLNRAQLIDDSFNLARANKLHYSIPFQLSLYLKIENDVIPWYSVISGYSYLLERMRRNDTEYAQLRVGRKHLFP